VSNEPFTPDDTLPVAYEVSNDLSEVSFAELAEISDLHIQDLDETVQLDKHDLVGVEMYILGWKFSTSEEYTDDDGEPAEFAIVTVRTFRDEVGVFTDGSTGICQSLHKYQARMERNGSWDDFVAGKKGGIKLPRGLNYKEYTKRLPNGEKVRATTFRFDNRER